MDLSTKPSNDEEIDRVLYAVDRGFLEFSYEEILLHEFGDSSRFDTLLIEIIHGASDDEVLRSGDALALLASAGYLVTNTPIELAEVMLGWAVSSVDDDVLDIATGSGTLLEIAASETDDSKLVCVEAHREVAKLADIRLRDIARAEALHADFFNWKVSEQVKLNTDKQEKTKCEEIPDKFDAAVGSPPMGQTHVTAPNRREDIRKWYSGRSTAAAFVC